ncbi:MAG: RNA methyltransferase [Pseudomonadota bacterium]
MTISESNKDDYIGDQNIDAAAAGAQDSSLRFVLVETSRPGNIGAAARAMKTMGYSQLTLVRPRFNAPAQEEEAIAFASGALDVLAAARVVGSIEEALAGCNIVAAVSARLREFSPPVMSPRAWASQLANSMDSNGDRRNNNCRAALVFGNERFGLPNEIVEKCDVLINIPANPVYSSLNLAQAVQILSYECAQGGHFATDDRSTRTNNAIVNTNAMDRINFSGQAADKRQVEAMFTHLEQALIAIDFLDPANPKRLMSRIRCLFARTGLENEEVNIWRGIARKILQIRR